MIPPPPTSTLFPYTTLFRSIRRLSQVRALRLNRAPGLPGTRIRSVRRSLSRLVAGGFSVRSEEHTSELQSLTNLVCRLLLEKKKKRNEKYHNVYHRLRLTDT